MSAPRERVGADVKKWIDIFKEMAIAPENQPSPAFVRKFLQGTATQEEQQDFYELLWSSSRPNSSLTHKAIFALGRLSALIDVLMADSSDEEIFERTTREIAHIDALVRGEHQRVHPHDDRDDSASDSRAEGNDSVIQEACVVYEHDVIADDGGSKEALNQEGSQTNMI